MGLDERGIAISDQRDGTPNGYHVLEVDSTDVSVRFKAAGKPADFQMRIMYDVMHHQQRKMPFVIPCMVRRLTVLCQRMKWLPRQFWLTSSMAGQSQKSATESTMGIMF